jgi:hydrogenase/urease accessory protein HupE
MGATTRTERRSRRRGQLARLAPTASRILGLVFFFVCAAARYASAHDPGLSSLDIRVAHDEITAILSIAAADVELAGPRGIGALAVESIQLWVDDRPLRASVDAISRDDSGAVHVKLVYRGTAGSRMIVKSTVAGHLARGHRELASVRAADGRLVSERMLDANWTEVESNVDVSTDDRLALVIRFFMLGVRHILTGYDHLLFLAALLVVVGGWRETFQTITAFTVAHSITLALATTGVVHAPSRVVEPLIAASIVYVGVENLLQAAPSARWKLTFVFGLIHGLGFAAALRDLGIGTSGAAVALPLASFNGGVEAGQIAVAAMLVPIFCRLRSRVRYGRLQFASAWSLFVVAAGCYWFLARVA